MLSGWKIYRGCDVPLVYRVPTYNLNQWSVRESDVSLSAKLHVYATLGLHLANSVMTGTADCTSCMEKIVCRYIFARNLLLHVDPSSKKIFTQNLA